MTSMKSFLPENVSNHDAYLPSRNVESTFFETKPIYLDKIFFSEAFSFARGRGISTGLYPFYRYQEYSLEFLRLKTQVNYLYISQGLSYYSFYHYNMYSQFRLAYRFFESEIDLSDSKNHVCDDLVFSTDDLLFYQIFFFPASKFSLSFNVTSGDHSGFTNSSFSYFDLKEFEMQLSDQPWENPNYTFLSSLRDSTFDFDNLFNPIMSLFEYNLFCDKLVIPEHPDNADHKISSTADPVELVDDLYTLKPDKFETSFSLPNVSQFSSIPSHLINYSFARGPSERSHYLRFFFFSHLAKASVSAEPFRILTRLRIDYPRVNKHVRPSTRNLDYSPFRLYANFPGSLLSAKDHILEKFIANYINRTRPIRRRIKNLSDPEREMPETYDDFVDSDSSNFWDTTSFASSNQFYSWPYSLGDFSILYAQTPFFQASLNDSDRDFQFHFTQVIRPPAQRKSWSRVMDRTFESVFSSDEHQYSPFLHLPSFWRATTYPFQEMDISEYYYFYNNKFASLWMPFKSETYSHFALNYYPIFLSSDAFLLRNAKRRFKLIPFSAKPSFLENEDLKKINFGLPVVAKKYTFGKPRRGRELASSELLNYLRGIKYFYFFYIDAFIRSVTYAFSSFLPKVFFFFNSTSNFEHFIKFLLFPLLYDRAAFHNFIFFVVKLDQFFYLTNGWYPYVHGRLSRRTEEEDYNDTFRRVLRFESTFEIICFYLGFFLFYFFFFFETVSSLIYYISLRGYFFSFSSPEVVFILTFFLDFVFLTPWFCFSSDFGFFGIEPLFAWVFHYSALF